MGSTTRIVVGSRIAQIVFNCIFSIGIIVGNIVLIGYILSRKELRHNSKYILINLLAVVDLYTGVLVLPLWTHTLVTQTFDDISCALLNIITGNDYIYPAISCLAIVSIALDYIFKASVRWYQGNIQKIITFVLALVYLGGPFIVIVPILVNGLAPGLASICIVDLWHGYYNAAYILSYWVPVACIILTFIVVIVLHQRSRRQIMYQQYNETSEQQSPPIRESNLPNPADLILAAIVTVALNLPYQILAFVTFWCDSPICYSYVMLLTVFTYFAEAKALLLPFVWFVNKDFRNIVAGRSNTSSQALQRFG